MDKGDDTGEESLFPLPDPSTDSPIPPHARSALLSIACLSGRKSEIPTRRCGWSAFPAAHCCHPCRPRIPSRPNPLTASTWHERPHRVGGGHGTRCGGVAEWSPFRICREISPFAQSPLFLFLELCLMDRVSFGEAGSGLNPLFPQPVSGVGASHLSGAQKRQRGGKELASKPFRKWAFCAGKEMASPSLPFPPSIYSPLSSSVVDPSAVGLATSTQATQSTPGRSARVQTALCQKGKWERKKGCE